MIKIINYRAIVGAVILLFVWVTEPSIASEDMSSWMKYRNAKFGFAFQYPKSLHERSVTGATNGVPTESVDFSTTPAVDKPQEGIQFYIQRNINPKHLSIDLWISEQTKGFKEPPTFVKTTLGKRTAMLLQRKSMFGNDYKYFVPLNASDILSISIIRPKSEKELSEIYRSILSTLEFLE